MSDENAEKAWRDYTGGVDPAEQPKSWHAFLAGRASRDAEVESLRRQLADAAEYLAGVKEADDSELRYRDEVEIPALRQQLAGSEHMRLWGEQKLAEAQAEQQSMEEGFRSFLGSYNRALNGLAERDAVIKRAPHDEDCSLNDWREWQDDPAPAPECNCWKSEAPPSTLDALIRQKQAEALEDFKSVVRGEGEPRHGGEWVSVNHVEDLLDECAAEYRNGADHE